MLHMLQWLYTYVASVYPQRFICFLYMYVASVSSVFFCMLQVLHLDVLKVNRASAADLYLINVDQIFRRCFSPPWWWADHAPATMVSGALRQDGASGRREPRVGAQKWCRKRTAGAVVWTPHPSERLDASKPEFIKHI